MTGNVNGQVVMEESGQPLEYASIFVTQGAGPAPDIAPLTDHQGRFMLDGLPEGVWTLHALGSAGETGESTIRVMADSRITVIIPVRKQ